MAAKKKTTKLPTVRQGDKTRFVRSLPRSLSADEVCEMGAKKGLIMSKAYVHNIRSSANIKSRDMLKKKGKKLVKGGVKMQEKVFNELVTSLGPARCKKLLEQADAALAAGAAS